MCLRDESSVAISSRALGREIGHVEMLACPLGQYCSCGAICHNVIILEPLLCHNKIVKISLMSLFETTVTHVPTILQT